GNPAARPAADPHPRLRRALRRLGRAGTGAPQVGQRGDARRRGHGVPHRPAARGGAGVGRRRREPHQARREVRDRADHPGAGDGQHAQARHPPGALPGPDRPHRGQHRRRRPLVAGPHL
ncbi:MAG: hypothetical protein AVDCRST_MAG06-2737, partial [uncultured Nocardioides sp.]